MLLEILSIFIFVQVRLQAKDLLSYLLVFSFDSFQLSFPGVEVQRASLELYHIDRAALLQSIG